MIDGRIFLVRSLYTTVDYHCYGTLVVELNRNKVFRDVPPSVRSNMLVCFNNNDAMIDFTNPEDAKKKALLDRLTAQYDGVSNLKMTREENGAYNGYLYQKKLDNYHIGVVLLAEKRELYSSLYEFYVIIFIMLLLFIPLFAYAQSYSDSDPENAGCITEDGDRRDGSGCGRQYAKPGISTS